MQKQKLTINEIINIGFKIILSIFMITMIVGIIDWVSTDWNAVVKESGDQIENMMKTVRCDISYKNFTYSGMCASDSEELWKFLNNMENQTNKFRNCQWMNQNQMYYCVED